MTQDKIIEMANEAGNADEEWSIIAKQLFKHFPEETQRFAALVAAAEREACAGLAERRMLIDKNKDKRIGHHHACKTIAEDIRSRGQA